MVGTSKTYKIISYVIMALWAAIIILPFLLLLMSSLTDEQVLVSNGYSFFPKQFSAASYQYIFQSGDTIMQAYGISILVTAVGTPRAVSGAREGPERTAGEGTCQRSRTASEVRRRVASSKPLVATMTGGRPAAS